MEQKVLSPISTLTGWPCMRSIRYVVWAVHGVEAVGMEALDPLNHNTPFPSCIGLSSCGFAHCRLNDRRNYRLVPNTLSKAILRPLELNNTHFHTDTDCLGLCETSTVYCLFVWCASIPLTNRMHTLHKHTHANTRTGQGQTHRQSG